VRQVQKTLQNYKNLQDIIAILGMGQVVLGPTILNLKLLYYISISKKKVVKLVDKPRFWGRLWPAYEGG
jgi:2-keto-3-deoxy-L-rhamnonate aldolase RhmA